MKRRRVIILKRYLPLHSSTPPDPLLSNPLKRPLKQMGQNMVQVRLKQVRHFFLKT